MTAINQKKIGNKIIDNYQRFKEQQTLNCDHSKIKSKNEDYIGVHCKK